MSVVSRVAIGLLLLLVLSAGFVSLLPASFVLKHLEAYIPQDLTVSQPKGTIWQGQLSVNYQGIEFERVSWQTRPLDVLLTALIKQQLPVDVQLAHQQDQLEMALILRPKTFTVSISQGHLNIARMISPFEQQVFMLRGLEGQLHLRDIQAKLTYNEIWPQRLSGRVVLIDLAVMGAKINQLNLEASSLEQKVSLQISAEQDGWQLAGSSRLIPPNRFEHSFILTTDHPNQFPDWALMIMQQTSPTQAQLHAQGRW